MEENQGLHLKQEEGRDRDIVRQLRREIDDYKRRCSDQSTELNELRRDRDQLQLDKNDTLIHHAKELETER